MLLKKSVREQAGRIDVLGTLWLPERPQSEMIQKGRAKAKTHRQRRLITKDSGEARRGSECVG